MSIPAGLVFIAGRSRERAAALLDIAKELGLEPQSVLAVRNGYHVAPAIAEFYTDGAVTEAEVTEAPVVVAEVVEVDAEVEFEVEVEETEAEIEAEAPEVEKPKGNASLEAWTAYAITKGYDPSRELTRNELVEEYGQD